MNIDLDRIPRNLDDAVDILMQALTPADREAIDRVLENARKKAEAGKQTLVRTQAGEPIDMTPHLVMNHFTAGMALRNTWSLWEDSPLARWFVETLKISHADDMSGIIREAFLARYQGQPYDPAPTVARYHRHWQKYYGPEAADSMVAEWHARNEPH